MSAPTEGLALPPDAVLGPNCGVTAVAIAAGIPFERAWDLLKGSRSVRWKGRTTEAERNAVLRELGVRLVPVRCPRMQLQTLVRRLNPDHRYIVRTTGHVQIIRGTMMVDQRGTRPVEGHLGRKIVTSVHRIDE